MLVQSLLGRVLQYSQSACRGRQRLFIFSRGWPKAWRVLAGAGFFLASRDSGRMLDHSFPRLCFFFFFKWRLDRAHYVNSLGQDQPTVAQRAETTVVECPLTSCMSARFRIGSHTMPGQRRSQPTPISLGICVFRCNLPPALLAE